MIGRCIYFVTLSTDLFYIDGNNLSKVEVFIKLPSPKSYYPTATFTEKLVIRSETKHLCI